MNEDIENQIKSKAKEFLGGKLHGVLGDSVNTDSLIDQGLERFGLGGKHGANPPTHESADEGESRGTYYGDPDDATTDVTDSPAPYESDYQDENDGYPARHDTIDEDAEEVADADEDERDRSNRYSGEEEDSEEEEPSEQDDENDEQ